MSATSARSLLLAALLLAACSDSAPRFVDVSVLNDGDDPHGPFQVAAIVRGGDGPLTVRLWLAPGDAAALEGECAGRPPHGAWRGVDAGPAGEPAACHTVELESEGSDRFTGTFVAPPFALGTVLHHVLIARDADGDGARWPAEGAASIVVGPSGRAPVVMALAPDRGPAAGGNEVALRGEGFAPEMTVRFGAEPATRLVVVSAHLALAIAPPGAPGTVALTAERSGRTSVLGGAYAYVAPPGIARVSPAEGPTAGGTLVVVEGEGFQRGATLRFGAGAATDVVFLDATSIAGVTPPGPAGALDVSVVNPDGQTAIVPGGWRYWPPPLLDSLAPDRGSDLGGTRVRVAGADLRAPAAVYLDGRPATEVEVTADGRAATFVAPPHREGEVDVVLFNPDGQSATLEAAFRYVGPPVLEAAAPPVAGRCGGSLVTLSGRNFEPGVRVFFGEREAEVVSVSDDGRSAVVRTPPGEPGPTRVRVENPDGRSARADDLVVYGVVPVVDRVEPFRVPVWGGVAVRVVGRDFEPGLAVSFDGIAAESVNLVEAGCEAQLEAVVPANEAGPADVRVRNADGADGLLRAGVEYVAPGLEPREGLVPGFTNVRLTGLDLRPGLTVQVGGRRPRALVRVSDEEWRLVTPEGNYGPAGVEVRNADGRGVVLESGFLYRWFVDRTRGRLEPDRDCNDVTVVDVDGDGMLDLATANGALNGFGQVDQPVGVHVNDGSGRFGRRALRPEGNGMNVKAGDIDEDGDPDLLVANLSNVRDELFINDGEGRFRADPAFPAAGGSYDADFIDVDADGDLDVFLLQTGSPEAGNATGPERLFLNEGDGRLVEQSEGVYFGRGDVHDHDLDHADLDGDGFPDMVIAVDNLSGSFESATNRLLLNTLGSEGRVGFRFAPAPMNRLRGDWLHVELVDVDGDGDHDVLMPHDYVEGLSDPSMPALALFLNDGAAGFEPAHERIVGLSPVPAFETVTADLDDDGDVDILLAVFGLLFQDGTIDASPSVALLNDGEARWHLAPGAFAESLAIPTSDFGVADFDGDGDLDVFECAAEGESRLWLRE